jgi:hypothetical protein
VIRCCLLVDRLPPESAPSQESFDNGWPPEIQSGSWIAGASDYGDATTNEEERWRKNQ